MFDVPEYPKLVDLEHFNIAKKLDRNLLASKKLKYWTVIVFIFRVYVYLFLVQLVVFWLFTNFKMFNFVWKNLYLTKFLCKWEKKREYLETIILYIPQNVQNINLSTRIVIMNISNFTLSKRLFSLLIFNDNIFSHK